MAATVTTAFAWSAIERGGQQAIGLVLSVILARILQPADFGLMAMVSAFLAVGGLFVEGGFGVSLIQQREITQEDKSSVFFFNLAASAGIIGLLCLLARPIAAFYRQPALAALIYVLSLRLLISALCAVQGAMLNRDMDFKTLTITNTWATVISGTLGIVIAFWGFGVWSLVGRALASACIYATLLWLMRPWRPSLVFRMASLKRMWSFGSKLMGSSLLDTIFQNLYPLVIGRMYSATALGLFSRAQSLAQVPAVLFYQTLGRVTFPLFSRMQEDRSALKQRFRKVVRFTCLAHFPVMVLMAVTAPELVRGLLTAKWDACVPYLQVLCIAGLLYPLHAVNLSVIQASGDGALFLRLEIIRKILLLGVLLATFRYGVMAMTYGLVAHTMVAYALNVAGSRRDLGYDWEEQAHDILPFVFCALCAGGAAWIAGHAWGGSVWTLLAIKLVTGVICYAALLGLGRHRVFAGDLTMLYDFARQIGRMARRAA